MNSQQVKKNQSLDTENVSTNNMSLDIERDINFILDIPLMITVELGRTKMVIKDLLKLSHGSVIELDKIPGEPIEILVNEKLIARGEVVMVNEKFGVRLTDIISTTERIKQLK
jgi:flagellar motor switch protein FliN/FliY